MEEEKNEEKEDPTLPMGRKALRAHLLGLMPTAEVAETLTMKVVLRQVAKEFKMDAEAQVCGVRGVVGGYAHANGVVVRISNADKMI